MITFRFLVVFAIIVLVAVIVTRRPVEQLEASPQLLVPRVVTWRGWGTALAWWPNVMAQIDDDRQQHILKLVFSRKKGLGLNIVRYLIPAGTNFIYSPQLLAYPERAVPGFLPASDGVYNWSADPHQREVLFAAKRYGANVFDAISFSPPWWMTMSKDVGGIEGGTTNIADENFGRFADYLVSVVEHYAREWNFTFDTISPLNEPLDRWWGFNSSQEGCGFTRTSILPFFHMVRNELDRRGLAKTGISGIDDWPEPTKFFVDAASNNRESLDIITRFQVHGYTSPTVVDPQKASLDHLIELRGSADQLGLELWQSEWGIINSQPLNLEDLPASLLLARSICEHINVLGVVAWSHWQAVDYCGGGPCSETWRQQFGLIRIPQPFNKTQPLFLSKQYYVTMHFSRWIRPGFEVRQVMGSLRRFMVTAVDKKRERLVVVAVNEGSRDAFYPIEPSLMQLVCPPKHRPEKMHVWIYRTSASEDHNRIRAGVQVEVCNKPYSIRVPLNSVVTTVVMLETSVKRRHSLS